VYDVVGFDVDGVLRRSRREIWHCVIQVLAHFRIPKCNWPTYGQFWCHYSEPYIAMWRRYGVTASEHEIVGEYTRFGGRDLSSPLYHDATGVVKKLVARGSLLTVVSASPEENIRMCLRGPHNSGIEGRFTTIIGQAYEKAGVLRRLREQFAREYGARSFAYVGDIASDMEAAQTAEWDGIAHAANHCAVCTLNGSPFVYRITRLRQLLPLSPPR